MKMVFSLLVLFYSIKIPSSCVLAYNNAHFCHLRAIPLQYGVLQIT